MNTQEQQSERTYNSKPNGEEKDPPEAKAQEAYPPPPPYAPEDFSQLAINRGQRRINGDLVLVDQKIADAIEELKNVLATALKGTNFDSVQAAIDGVKEASNEVAGIIPPGCEYKTSTN